MPSDSFAPVIRYVQLLSESEQVDGTVHRRQAVLCPECGDGTEAPYYEHHESGVIHQFQLCYVDSETPHTVCNNDECDYESSRRTQIRSTDQRFEIGPLREQTRERYPHSDEVALQGGIGHI